MKRAERQPQATELTLYAGIFLKTWTMPDAGMIVPQHAHQHPHISLIMSGSVRVLSDGGTSGEFSAPAAVKLPALVKHSFITLTDNVTIACIHADSVVVADEHVLELED